MLVLIFRATTIKIEQEIFLLVERKMEQESILVNTEKERMRRCKEIKHKKTNCKIGWYKHIRSESH